MKRRILFLMTLVFVGPAFAEDGLKVDMLQQIKDLKPSKKTWSQDGEALKKMVEDYLSLAIKDIEDRLKKLKDVLGGHDKAIGEKNEKIEELRKDLSTIKADIKKEVPAADGSVLDAHPFQKIEISLGQIAEYDRELASINTFLQTHEKLYTSENQYYYDRKNARDSKLSKYHKREDISGLQKAILKLKKDTEQHVSKLKELKKAKTDNAKLKKIAQEAVAQSKKDKENAQHALNALEDVLKVLKEEKKRVDAGTATVSTYKDWLVRSYKKLKENHDLHSSDNEFRQDFHAFVDVQLKRVEATIRALENIVAAESKNHLLKSKAIKEYAI